MSSPLVAAVDLCLSTYLAKEEQNFADFVCKGDIPPSQKNFDSEKLYFRDLFHILLIYRAPQQKHYILEMQKNSLLHILCFLSGALCVSLSFFRAPAVFIKLATIVWVLIATQICFGQSTCHLQLQNKDNYKQLLWLWLYCDEYAFGKSTTESINTVTCYLIFS